MLVLRSNGTAIYEQITLTKNKGGTSEAGMLQSVEGSTTEPEARGCDIEYFLTYVTCITMCRGRRTTFF
jgi:hypothetical protein